jgi:hypothetical protein
MFIKLGKINYLFLWVIFLTTPLAEAYEVEVHRIMSEEAYNQSVLSPSNGNFLSELGPRENEAINGRRIIGWLSLGSILEDYQCCSRPLNHFYDPTTGNGLLNLPDFIATDALNWGLELQTTGTLTQSWSIPDARGYFYLGLTHPDPVVREENLAKTFRALGHAIHLIQDMGQPQHVRNDPHFHTNYWPFRYFLNWDRSRYEEDTDKRRENLTYTGYPPVKLNQFISYWDSDDGKGLAKLTQKNFLSEERDRIICSGDICNEENYPQPAFIKSSGVNETLSVQLQDGTQKNGVFTFYPHTFNDPITQETVTNPRLLSLSLFDMDLEERGGNPIFSQNPFTFQETADILVPRAVGYSAGLINYFFRGRLAVEPVDDTHLRVYNQSSEPLNSGTIELFYDDSLNQRLSVTSSPFVISSPIAPGQISDPIPYTPPSDNANPGRYWAVFKGTLGSEESAVIGSYGFLWEEEWDNGITGSHSWWHMATDPLFLNSLDPGSVINTETSNGILTMENKRIPQYLYTDPDTGIDYFGYPNNQANESIIGVLDYVGTNDEIYFDGFPIPVTPDTEIQVKITELSTLAQPPPECAFQGLNGAYQNIDIDFNQDFFLGPDIELTIPGQQLVAGDTLKPVFISLGQDTRVNIYQALQDRGAVITQPLEITNIGITQQLYKVCDPFPTPQSQIIKVDYIRILDVPQIP